MKIWIVVGTRPEVIKQIPVYWACQKVFGAPNVKLIGTGQHKELLAQALAHFGVQLDLNFEIMKPGQSLSKIAAAVMEKFDEALEMETPDWVIVQGDTTTAAMAALATFHKKIKIAHNEAGLRSYDLLNPFPEEANRKIISSVANVHFVPTELASSALIKENVNKKSIYCVGNPGIDSLYWTLNQKIPLRIESLLKDLENKKMSPVLMTAHRRENAGSTMDQWFEVLKDFFTKNSDLNLICPMHPNNLALDHAQKHLKNMSNVLLCEPFNYLETCHLLKASRMVVTDSGGLQEESATLGIPAVVCRKTTERMEGVLANRALLVDTDLISDSLPKALNWALATPKLEQNTQIFGDGFSGLRMAQTLASLT